MIIATETTDQQLTNRSRRRLARLAAAALATAAVLAIAGFTALGSIFSYPQILHEPVEVVLNRFRDHQAAVMGWFAVLTLSAALMAPAGSWLGRLRGGILGRWITGLGIAAAVVQVAGLQRWITIVPGISEQALDPGSQAASESAFLFWHRLLDTAIGETVGYALTAAFTVLVVIAFDRRLLPRWLVGARRSGRHLDRHRGDNPGRVRRQPDQLRWLRLVVRLAPCRRRVPHQGGSKRFRVPNLTPYFRRLHVTRRAMISRIQVRSAKPPWISTVRIGK